MNSDNMKKAAEFLGNILVKEFVIKEASIKDDFCNYTFEVASGVGIGDTHNVKGKGIIMEANDATPTIKWRRHSPGENFISSKFSKRF